MQDVQTSLLPLWGIIPVRLLDGRVISHEDTKQACMPNESFSAFEKVFKKDKDYRTRFNVKFPFHLS